MYVVYIKRREKLVLIIVTEIKICELVLTHHNHTSFRVIVPTFTGNLVSTVLLMCFQNEIFKIF